MALAGAWVRTDLGGHCSVFTGRTFGADDDTAALGLNGDAGADAGFTMPAGWPTGTTETAPTDAQRHLRTRVTCNPITDPEGAAGVEPNFSVEEGSAPWQKIFRLTGTPTVAVGVRIFVEWIHSAVR